MIGKNRGIIELREGYPFRPAPAALAKQTFVQMYSYKTLSNQRNATSLVFGCGKLFEKCVKKVFTKTFSFGIIGV